MLFLCHVSGARVFVNDGVATILRSLIKKVASVNPVPPVRVPSEGSQFPIEEIDLFFFPFLLWSPNGVNNVNLMKVTFQFTKGPFPRSKASTVRAYHVALYQERQGKVMPLQTFRCKIRFTLKDKGRIFFSFYIVSKPLSKVCNIFIHV